MRGEPPTKKLDVFSFGMVLWEFYHLLPVHQNIPVNTESEKIGIALTAFFNQDLNYLHSDRVHEISCRF